jgi:prefoldin subunit 5
MTVEELETRIKYLAAEREKFVAEVHAVNGAIKDCEFWIERLKGGGQEDPPVKLVQ